MGLRDSLDAKSSIEEQMRKAQTHFESQLVKLGLAKQQIENQTLEELNQSLETINDAIEHPDSFGTIKLKITADVGLVITTTAAEAHYEIGILPLLLERKKLILERIRLLKDEQKIENLRDLIKNVPEGDVRSRLDEELEKLRTESQRLLQQTKEVEQARIQEQLNTQERLARLQMEMSESRARILRSFLERESVATIVGGILLVIFSITQIAAMFLNIESTEIISNSFLLILGYFFGQAISFRSRAG